VVAIASAGGDARSAPASPPVAGSSVVLAFVPAPAGGALESELARSAGMSVSIMSAAEGSYTAAQLALDITQGARVSAAAYPSPRPPALELVPAGAGALVRGFDAARERAEDAPALLRPGLLAARVPGGAGYAGPLAGDHLDATVAADGAGRVAAASLGAPQTLPARVRALLASVHLVVCDLAAGPDGAAQLGALSRARAPGELLLAVQRAPDAAAGELLWVGVAGLGTGKELSSATTNQRGLVAAIDLAPTALRHLGVGPLPAAIRGAPVHTDGALDAGELRSLMARLRVIGPRRLQALGFLLCGWALVLALAALAPAGARGAAGARALRTGALALLWAPSAALVTAALQPSAAVEFVTLTLGCLALAALTDALAPWPRGPIAPALVAVVAISADALSHAQLEMRSLLGPDPILGARFYGIGNELKSGLAVLVLAATAAAVAGAGASDEPASRRRLAAVAIAGCGALLALIEGWARIGAAVGGVVLVCAGTAVATAMLLPGRLTRRRALIALVTPLAGLVVLAALDLATAHGTGHYTGSILHAHSAGDVRDLLVRRYSAAWRELKNDAMPAATAIALACAALALRFGEELLAPVRADPIWRAALLGGLVAGVVGALVEDSGPLLLVVAAVALGCVLAYLWGSPRPARRAPGMSELRVSAIEAR
jgi:hypothetical protein